MTKYLTIQLLGDKLSRQKTWIYDRVKNDPTFPRPKVIAGRQQWSDDEIDAWVAAQDGCTKAAYKDKTVGVAA